MNKDGQSKAGPYAAAITGDASVMYALPARYMQFIDDNP
jgi:hypothetical protein